MKSHKDYQWYHPIKLPNGETTLPEHDYSPSWRLIAECMPWSECNDKIVLDIGCRDGLFSLKAEQAGARAVYAIDSCLSRGLVEFIIPTFKSNIIAYEISLFDLIQVTYDTILFFGVLYHLRYPFLGLRKCLEMLNPGGTLYIETALLTDPKFQSLPMLYCPIHGHSGYDQSSCSFFNLEGLTQTLNSLGASCKVKGYSKLPVGNPIVDRVFVEVKKTSPAVTENTLNYWHGIHNSYQRPTHVQ